MKQIFLTCLLVLFTQSICGQKPSPNIVFIIADDYGYHDIGYHGSEIRTPHMNNLAANGVKLENYYVQPICTPSRSQLLTGRYQIHTGMQHGVLTPISLGGLPLDLPTLPDQLRKAGYATHMVGKWHLGYHMKEYTPTYRGFDTFFGMYNGYEDHFDHRVLGGFDLHFHQKDQMEVAWNNTEYTTISFGNRAVEIIDNHDATKPLFLYLAFLAVHEPLQVPEEYLADYEDINDEDRRIYAGMTSCMDDAIRNVTDALKTNKLWDNTIVVFTSDNGGFERFGGYNYPLRGGKGSLYEGGVRSVGFVSGPLVPHHVINTGLIHISDWYPTLVTLAGGSLDDPDLELDGHDVWKSIIGNEPSPRKELLHNINPVLVNSGDNPYPEVFDARVSSAIRVGHYKLLTGRSGNSEHTPPPSDPDADPCSDIPYRNDKQEKAKNIRLYNIKDDPSECVDMSASQPDKVMELLERLRFYNSTAVPVVVPPQDWGHRPGLTEGAWVPWVV